MSSRTPGPPGGWKTSIFPGLGWKLRAGSSALTRHSMTWPRASGSEVNDSFSPAATQFGVEGAFTGARICHALTVVLLALVGFGLALGLWYWLGGGVVAALLAYEHAIVRPGDLRRLDAAFFTVNGVISVAFFVFVLAETTG